MGIRLSILGATKHFKNAPIPFAHLCMSICSNSRTDNRISQNLISESFLCNLLTYVQFSLKLNKILDTLLEDQRASLTGC
jgi:hypothetical protein